MKNILSKVRSQNGNTTMLAAAAVLICFLFTSVLIQLGTLYVTLSGTKDFIQNEMVNDVQNNYTTTYYGFREKSSEAYTPDGYSGWNDTSTTKRVKAELRSALGLNDNFEKHDSNGNLKFVIKDLKVMIHNPTFNHTSDDNYGEKATFTVQIPMFLAGNVLPPCNTSITVKAKNTPKF